MVRRFARIWLAALPVLTLGTVDCYSTGDGSPPPLDRFYFPVGLSVSNGGSVLYAINSDFDLQFNGGTIQSYDLHLIRRHAAALITDPNDPNVPILDRGAVASGACPGNPPLFKGDGSGQRQPLGQTCAPPVDSTFYVRDAAIVGAFATDMLLSPPPAALAANVPAGQAPPAGDRRFDRLFAPIRGNASLTWASVERDGDAVVPPADKNAFYAPFVIHCGQDASRRCDAFHQAGEDPNEPGNTRHLTMPGEPFAVSMSPDGESLVITHQGDTTTSLFSTGLTRSQNDAPGATADDAPPPALEYVLNNLDFGGTGIAAIPYDADAFLGTGLAVPRAGFLETSRVAAEVTLLRRYQDEFGGAASSLRRPFLDKEAAFPISVSPNGTDSRGIAIDPTPRIACKAKVAPVDPLKGRTQADVDRDIVACARKPARVFIANRTPSSLLIGEIGGQTNADQSYDPDRLVIRSSVPVANGPSKVYLAPIVDTDGAYALRVFVVCFDAAQVYVFDPDTGALENVIPVAPGPYAMAFDPFSLADVATHAKVPFDPRDPGTGLRRYRFAYVASFTQSYVQLLDLDDAKPNPATFERVVFSLGRPTLPKGS